VRRRLRALEVRAQHEGDEVAPLEPVLQIAGDYTLFAHLETVYLGTLARRTLDHAQRPRGRRGGPRQADLLLPRPARPLARAGPATAGPRTSPAPIGVSTDAQASWWGGTGMGTIPHGLIARTPATPSRRRGRSPTEYAREMADTVLVDFDNDSVRTALEVADALGDDLWGVRLDTSGTHRRPVAVGGDERRSSRPA
jgi:nicotinate phosphoribosyltransferase